jgi:hypothetical protein
VWALDVPEGANEYRRLPYIAKELMNFQEIDQEAIRAIIEETDANGVRIHQDLLAPLAEKEAAFFRNSSCSSCRGHNLEAFIDCSRPFAPGNPLPNRHLRCLDCRAEFDPYSGFILKVSVDADSPFPR